MPPVNVRTRRLAVVFVVWTVFVWGNRVLNAVRDGEGPGALLLSGIIAAVTVIFVASLWRASKDAGPLDAVTNGGLRLLPACTAMIWVVRGLDIALGDHEAAFIAVHLVLAGVSVALAVLVWRSLSQPTWSVAEAGR